MKNLKKSLLLLTLTTVCGTYLHAGTLHDLVCKGDVKKVEQFLNNNINIDVDELDSSGNTPLGKACFKGYVEIIKLLLSHGADVNKSNSVNSTPLFEACRNGLTNIVTLLLFLGADVNKPGCSNTTPLWEACCHGYTEIVELLLLHGADANKLNHNNDTSLRVACDFRCTKIVKLLLSYGADVNKPGSDNYTPLQTACHEYTEVEISTLSSQGVQEACCHDYTEMVKLLLLHGADINKPGYNNKTPLDEIKTLTTEKQTALFKELLSIQQKKVETKQDSYTRRFIEFSVDDHAAWFNNQNKTLIPFILANDLLLEEGFKDVQNKEFIISLGEEILDNLFFRFEKNKKFTLPLFVFEQSKMALHPYVKQLKLQRDTQVLKNHDLKSFEDFVYRLNLVTFAQQCGKKRNKRQKSTVKFEDVTLNFNNN